MRLMSVKPLPSRAVRVKVWVVAAVVVDGVAAARVGARGTVGGVV
jgi:uncharacterized Zn-binding protein involved in type VI secretion